MTLYVAPDSYGDTTVWRHDPNRPDMPTALLCHYHVDDDLWAHIIRDLPTSPAATGSDQAHP